MPAMKKFRLMLKRLIRYSALAFVLLGLAACATGPVPDGASPQRQSKKVKVSDETQATYQRALWAVKSGRDAEALTLFKKVTAQNPDLAGGFINQGLLYLKVNKYPEAENAFKQAVTVNPASAVGYNHLGVVYRYTGKFDEAKKAYMQALKINANYALAHLNLGILYDIYLQDFAQALNHYQRYKALNNNDDAVDKWIVDLERRLKRNNQAKTQQKG